VNVIRHHDRNTQILLRSVVVQTAPEHDRPHLLRQDPSPLSAESNKVLPIIQLKVRQLTPVKSLWHRGLEFDYVGTAAFGCPRSEASRF